jgi:hypothetical protein
MSRKKKKKVIRFTHKEIKTLAKIGGKILTKQAINRRVAHSNKSFKCPICYETYCISTNGKQIYCNECPLGLSKCEKQEYITKTCRRCK